MSRAMDEDKPIKYGVISPYTRQFYVMEARDLDTAKRAAGLKPLETDHGRVTDNLFIVVYEYGLTDPKPDQAYFCLFGNLYAGGAVLYQIDERGATVDFEPDPELIDSIRFYGSANEAELAIRMGFVRRPQTSVNGVVCWEWRP